MAEPPVVGTPDHLRVMADIAAGSITELRNTVLPLHAGARVLVTGWGATTTTNLAAALGATRLYPATPGPATAAALQADVTVVTTYNAWADPAQPELVKALLATGRPVVVVAVGGPYDIAAFPAATTYLATYDYQPASIAALAEVLLGRHAAHGRLPVTVEGFFRYGSKLR